MRAQTVRRALVFASLFTATRLPAQELYGELLLADGVSPAMGVVLEAFRTGSRIPVARAISGAEGGFSLRLGTERVTVRAIRIGFRPAELGEYALAVGERRHVRLTLTSAPIVLASVVTRADARCETIDKVGARVATLFDEAQKALRASLLTPPEGRPSARILLMQSVTEPDGRPRVGVTREVKSGFAARPFRSAPPAQLAALGYAVSDQTGTTYFAPDANVVLSEQFAAMHCLRLARADTAHPSRIGIAFEPIGRVRESVRIKGTLWLDSTSLGLERLEFLYLGLPGNLDSKGLGGAIEFSRLPDGLWFEDRWEIRMPRVKQINTEFAGIRSVDGSGVQFELDAVQRAGGRVVSITRGTHVLYESVGSEPELTRPTDPRDVALGELLVRAACTSASAGTQERSVVVGHVFEKDRRPASGATVTATWQEGFRIGGSSGLSWSTMSLSTTATDDGFYALCSAPRERRIPVRARLGERMTPRTVLRFEADVASARADLRFVNLP